MRIVIVGGGMQGKVIARNLTSRAEKVQVVVADLQKPVGLPLGVEFVQSNVLDPEQAKSIAKGADAVILAVPSSIAREALANLIPAGAPIADVSFTPDPPLDLAKKAQEFGTVCVVDCGVAPGLSHILVGAAQAEFGNLDTVRILVGGMPQSPPAVFRHAVYFNPHDLLAEYIRPARARRAGKAIDPDPLAATVETLHDHELGNLECFISDGLRSLLTSYPKVATMYELTLRWPGHLETMRNLREMGLFESPDAVREIASTLGSRYPASAHEDVLLMIVEAKQGERLRRWRLIDRFTNGESAMSRTTGFTTAAVAMVLARGQFKEAGVHAPEKLGETAELAKAIVNDLAQFGVRVEELVAEPVA